MDQDSNNMPEQKPKGYGKRPMWRWVVLYFVIAVVVYGAIYWFLIRDSSSTGSGIY